MPLPGDQQDHAVSPGPRSLNTWVSLGKRRERWDEGSRWGQMEGHGPDSQQGDCPASSLSETSLAFAQVPRAFVNLVKTMQIVNLRELYYDNKVYCPRLILR